MKHTRQDSKDGKQSPVVDKKAPVKALATTAPSPDKRSPQAIKVEKAARDVVRVLNKQAVNNNKGVAAVPSSTPPPAVTPSANVTPSPLADKKRERGSVSAAARILQRDLGLGVVPGARGGRRGGSAVPGRAATNNAASTVKQDLGSSSQTSKEPGVGPVDVPAKQAATASPATTIPPNNHIPQAPAQLPAGPYAVRAPQKSSPSQTINNIAPNSGFSKATPAPSTATQAFLKHANPSQGITEPLLEEAFAGFGTIKKVEIDKKKGFAYIDFAEPQSLQNAIKASPVKVAQGQVVVLERKTGPTLQARNMRGGSPTMGNRGGGGPIMRGGGAPMVSRGGRGGSMRRGGGPSTPGKGANPFANAIASNAPTTIASPSSQGGANGDLPVASAPNKPADASSAAGSANVSSSTPSTTAPAVSTASSESQGT